MSLLMRVTPFFFRRISPLGGGRKVIVNLSRQSPVLFPSVNPSQNIRCSSTQNCLLSPSLSTATPWFQPKPSPFLPQRFYSSPSAASPGGDDALVWLNAQQFLSDNKVEEALEVIENGIQENKESHFLLSRLADIYMATSEFEKVIDTCDRAIGLPGSDQNDFLSMQGEAYDRLKNFDMARQKYEEVLQNNPKNALITQRYGYLLLSTTDWSSNATEKYQPVVEAFDRALEIAPDDPENHYGRGLALFYGQQFDEAIEALNKSTELDPKYAPAWQKLSLGYLVRKDFESSIHAADQFFDSAKDYYSKLSVDLTFGVDDVIFDLMLKRGICYMMLKDFRMVIGCMEAMLEGAKDIPIKIKLEALSLQAQAHFEEGEHWDCIKVANECIEMEKEFFPAYKVRSDAYAALGRTSSAEEDRQMCMHLIGKQPPSS